MCVSSLIWSNTLLADYYLIITNEMSFRASQCETNSLYNNKWFILTCRMRSFFYFKFSQIFQFWLENTILSFFVRFYDCLINLYDDVNHFAASVLLAWKRNAIQRLYYLIKFNNCNYVQLTRIISNFPSLFFFFLHFVGRYWGIKYNNPITNWEMTHFQIYNVIWW